jgi:DNA replication licensing factor MCM7
VLCLCLQDNKPQYLSANAVIIALTEKLKQFLMEFTTVDGALRKQFKYASEITKLAHREQVELVVELDDVHDFDSDLVEAFINNARRYSAMVSDVVYELLPTYKEKEVCLSVGVSVANGHMIKA